MADKKEVQENDDQLVSSIQTLTKENDELRNKVEYYD